MKIFLEYRYMITQINTCMIVGYMIKSLKIPTCWRRKYDMQLNCDSCMSLKDAKKVLIEIRDGRSSTTFGVQVWITLSDLLCCEF